ncbi:alpha/beta hydrolase fold domain-containing protein [Geodermatophilus sp. SYSU D01119]
MTTVTPRGGATRAVLYLHGGAYVAGAAPQHWTLAGRLADAGARVVVLAGDSAGGGLALGFAQTLLGTGEPQPRLVALIAPWLDLALADPAVAAAA